MVFFTWIFRFIVVFSSFFCSTCTQKFGPEHLKHQLLKGKNDLFSSNEYADVKDTSIVRYVEGGDACASAKSCENCTALSKWYGGCHWCSHDQACHAVGSWSGCAIGASCSNKPAPKPDKNDVNNTCYTQSNCRDCALLSHLCHWCAHDNACHVIGSTSGCVTGVDCYDNAHCQRKEPEPLPKKKFSFRNVTKEIGWVPLLLLTAVFGSALCCATMCCCIATGIKGAYDELAEIAAATQNNAELSSPLLPARPFPTAPLESVANPIDKSSPILLQQVADGQPASVTAVNQGELEPLLVTSPQDIETSASTLEVGNTVTTTITTTSTTTILRSNGSVKRSAPRSMQRLYNACICCYLFVALIIITLPLAAIRYYPGIPVYNVCNDNVAWKSLIDSLTRMKATADFEILTSISNPNYLEVALDGASGSFTHNGAFVGTFDIPPTIIAANSITDVLMVAHLQPDKWDALNLAAEYYSGRLVLIVDIAVTVRIPALMDYTFRSKVEGMQVNVNEQSDRTYCACPTWNDPSPPNKTIPTFLQLTSS